MIYHSWLLTWVAKKHFNVPSSLFVLAVNKIKKTKLLAANPIISKNLEIHIESKTGSLGFPFPPHRKHKRKKESEKKGKRKRKLMKVNCFIFNKTTKL
jgi:hypothetical protein